MAEPTTSECSSPDTDKEFDPTAEMLVDEYDDEKTLDEEEAMSGESFGSEMDDLQKESEMPIEELMAMYRYGSGGLPPAGIEPASESRSSSEEEILSNQDLTLDKDEIARDVLKEDREPPETKDPQANDIMAIEMPSQTVRLLRSNSRAGSSEESEEDEDYIPVQEDNWKKTISVGHDYQAMVPEGMSNYGDAPAYENEDRLLWDPNKLEPEQVERYLKELNACSQQTATGVNAIPLGEHTRDDEQSLYLLLQCGHNIEEAIRRRKMQSVPTSDPMSLWSEEECRNFENGLQTYGKDFYLIQQNKVRTRSVGELVQFYYLWKKTERHDAFANKNRLEKKKYALHPGVTDYMDRFLDEQDNPQVNRDRSASPILSLLSGDPKRHPVLPADPKTSEQIAAAFEMVQKVVGDDMLSPSKLLHNPELNTATPTTISINSELRDRQSSENTVHIASFAPVSPAAAKPDSVTPVKPHINNPLAPDTGGEPSAAKRLKLDTEVVAAPAEDLPLSSHPNSKPCSAVLLEETKVKGKTSPIKATMSSDNNHIGNVELSIASVNSIHNNIERAHDPQSRHPTAESVAQ